MKLQWRGLAWPTIFLPAPRIDANKREELIRALVAGSWFDIDYAALIVSSCAIATFGLLENSVAVIIGAMIIAPLMPVIQAIAFGALDGSFPTFRRSVITLAFGVAAAVLFSALLARIIGLTDFGGEIMSRVRPNLLDLGIALAAGAIGAFARVRPSIANSLAGTAIAVALMPPLCVVGIGIAAGDWEISRGAALLFTTNLLGITLASMVVFLISRIAHQRAIPALAWTGAVTALIVIPLGLSFQTLVRQSALENALRQGFTHQTVTFRQATLVSSRFDWLTKPPDVTLDVRSTTMLSSHQVALLEAFAQRLTGQRFRLIIDVSQAQRVTAGEYNADIQSKNPIDVPGVLTHK